MGGLKGGDGGIQSAFDFLGLGAVKGSPATQDGMYANIEIIGDGANFFGFGGGGDTGFHAIETSLFYLIE